MGTRLANAGSVRRVVLPAALTLLVWAASAERAAPRRARSHPAERGPAAAEPDEPVPVAESEPTEDPEGPRAILPCLLPSSVRGVVVDPEGFGVAGVLVQAEFGRVTCRRGFGSSVVCSRAEARTDSRGMFVLESVDAAQWAIVCVAAPGWVEPEPRSARRGAGTTVIRGPRSSAWLQPLLPPGVGRDRFPADTRAIFRTTDDGQWPEMKILLERGASIEGTVETEDGVAVPGALVTALWRDEEPGLRCSETRADGRGRFSIIVPCAVLLTAATVAGDDPEVVDDPRAQAGPVLPGSKVRLVMRDPLSLELRVRGPSGPVRGAAVTLTPSCGLPEIRRWVEHDEACETLRLECLMPGTYDVEVEPYDDDCLATVVSVTVPGPPVDVCCPPARRIEGLVEGENIGCFDVTWTGPGDRDVDTARLRFEEEPPDPPPQLDTGHFAFGKAGDGPGDIYVRREGDPRYALVSAYSPAQGCLRLTLEEGKAIHGRVEGSPGRDLSALRVRAVAGGLTQYAKVDADGTFAILGLPPRVFRVELRSDWWLHDARDDVPAGAEDVRLRVRLPATDPGGP